MRTYPLFDSNGEVFAFEIPSSYFLTSGAVSKFFKKYHRVKITKTRKLLDFRQEVRAEFLIGEIEFEVWEPYGDNSRFWVGPKGENPTRVAEIDGLITFTNSNWPGVISKTRAKILSWFGVHA